MEYLLYLDKEIFVIINQNISNPVFDVLLVFMRNRIVWIPLYFFIASFLTFNLGKKGLTILLFALITGGFSDYMSSSIIKPLVARPRPCNEKAFEIKVISRIDCGGAYSFPSSHATNHFALGMFFFLFFRKIIKKYASLFLIWAGLIAFSQVYVGVHYPLDVIGGAILGSTIGWFIFWLCEFTVQRMFSRDKYLAL
jgi:membrane-associated phospholipid phosphatase